MHNSEADEEIRRVAGRMKNSEFAIVGKMFGPPEKRRGFHIGFNITDIIVLTCIHVAQPILSVEELLQNCSGPYG